MTSTSNALGRDSEQHHAIVPLDSRRSRSSAGSFEDTAGVQDAAPSTPRRHLVRITVVDRLSRTPVPHANIELHFTAEDNASSDSHVGQADADGQFVTELPPGSLRVGAWSDANVAASMLALTLEGRREHCIEIALDACALVIGHVSDSITGAPVEGVRVFAPTVSGLEWAETGRSGDFQYTRFPVGRGHRLVFEKSGYARALRVLTIATDGAWTVLAAPGSEGEVRGPQTPAHVRVALLPELRIEGRVVDARNRPIAEADLSVEGYFHLMPEAATPDLGEAKSDAEGNFSIAQLRPDLSHSLLVRARGYSEALIELPAAKTGIQAVGTIRLEFPGSLEGIAADASGRPLEDMEVRLTFLDREGANLEAAAKGVDNAGVPLSPDAGKRVQGRHRYTRSDALGEFKFEGLGAGRYELQVRGESSSSITQCTVELAAGERRTGVVLNLPTSCVTLLGRVERDGTPVSGARVLLERLGWAADVGTGPDGQFWIGGLDDTGPYHLYVQHAEPATGLEWEAHASHWATAYCVLELDPVIE